VSRSTGATSSLSAGAGPTRTASPLSGSSLPAATAGARRPTTIGPAPGTSPPSRPSSAASGAGRGCAGESWREAP